MAYVIVFSIFHHIVNTFKYTSIVLKYTKLILTKIKNLFHLIHIIHVV